MKAWTKEQLYKVGENLKVFIGSCEVRNSKDWREIKRNHTPKMWIRLQTLGERKIIIKIVELESPREKWKKKSEHLLKMSRGDRGRLEDLLWFNLESWCSKNDCFWKQQALWVSLKVALGFQAYKYAQKNYKLLLKA